MGAFETMALSSLPRTNVYSSFLLFLLFHASNGFHLSHRQDYFTGDPVYVHVNSLTSINAAIPFSYYSLPYCEPSWGILRSRENLGELLQGDEILRSPYSFRMNVNKSFYLCSHSLTKHETELLKQRIDDLYQVNMFLDHLPAMRFVLNNETNIQLTGFPVGYKLHGGDDLFYIINHLKFRVLINKCEESNSYTIVGFEVVPRSVRYDSPEMARSHMSDSLKSGKAQIVREQETISFTYEVEFVKSNIEWPSRWDAYLKGHGNDRVHWFSNLGSMVVVMFLAGVILRILWRDLMKRHQGLDGENQTNDQEVLRWKLVSGDAFRAPSHSKLLCVMVGNGVQILGTTVVTVLFAFLGLVSPALEGTLLTWVILLYLFSGIAGGYVSVYMWSSIKGCSEGWRSFCWLTASFFPGFVLLVSIPMRFILWESHSTHANPIYIFFTLFSLWFFILLPLTFFGGHLASNSKTIEYPLKTNPIPRELPRRKLSSFLAVLVGGVIPHGVLFIQLLFILTSIWMGRFYTSFGNLLLDLLLLVIACAEISVIVTYGRLNREDWMWWWKAFYASGSAGLYVFQYWYSYLVIDLNYLNGPKSCVLYIGYTLIVAVAVMLATGTIGFLASFYFVRYLYLFAP